MRMTSTKRPAQTDQKSRSGIKKERGKSSIDSCSLQKLIDLEID